MSLHSMFNTCILYLMSIHILMRTPKRWSKSLSWWRKKGLLKIWSTFHNSQPATRHLSARECFTEVFSAALLLARHRFIDLLYVMILRVLRTPLFNPVDRQANQQLRISQILENMVDGMPGLRINVHSETKTNTVPCQRTGRMSNGSHRWTTKSHCREWNLIHTRLLPMWRSS